MPIFLCKTMKKEKLFLFHDINLRLIDDRRHISTNWVNYNETYDAINTF